MNYDEERRLRFVENALIEVRAELRLVKWAVPILLSGAGLALAVMRG